MMDYDLEREKQGKRKKDDEDDSKEFSIQSPFASKNGSSLLYTLLTVINVLILCGSVYFYVQSQSPVSSSTSPTAVVETSTPQKESMPSALFDEVQNQVDLPACDDPVWCKVAMPKVSYFHFEPPTDGYRWRLAQLQAASGEQVLLREAVKVFPSHFDYLDGDITFRRLHLAMDMFVDERRDFSPLVSSNKKKAVIAGTAEEDPTSPENVEVSGSSNPFEAATPEGRRLEASLITSPKMVNGVLKYPWEVERRRVVPDPYDFRAVDRAPVISLGYTAYKRDSQTYFSGDRIGGAFIDRKTLYKHWRKAKDRIDTPFILVCSLNENWGFLSTKFPNRTAGWGQCCNSKQDQLLYELLNHDKTLMLVTNQHTNVSHPKIMILPRGIPLTWGQTRILVWDMQRIALQKQKKNKLLFAAGSKWGPRPQILACISNKFAGEDFDGHVKNSPQQRYDRSQYYLKLSSTMFGLGLPGLGYDTFRAWELMTMGSIVVLEKAVGFDRSMWRLPALFVEDFDELTPELLRTAYVEALYHAKDFEFKRLTMNYWFSVIGNVSAAKSTQPLLDAFPVEAEEPNFARPREPYECGKTNSCGPGVKRTPKSSC